MTHKEFFKDTSIFVGVRECLTPSGELRFIIEDSHVEVRRNLDSGWFHVVNLSYKKWGIRRNSSLQSLHRAFEEFELTSDK